MPNNSVTFITIQNENASPALVKLHDDLAKALEVYASEGGAVQIHTYVDGAPEIARLTEHNLKQHQRIIDLEALLAQRPPSDKPLYRATVVSTVNVRDKNGNLTNQTLSPGIVVDVWAEQKIGGYDNRAVIDPLSNPNPRNVWLNNLRRTEVGGDENNSQFFWPTDFRVVTQRYGENPNKFGYGAAGHEGLDLRAPTGSNIYACLSGLAVLLPNFGSYGNTIRAVTGNTRIEYCHLSKILILAGEVRRGQVIGLAGETGNTRGPHLHLNVFVNGKRVDPASYLGV